MGIEHEERTITVQVQREGWVTILTCDKCGEVVETHEQLGYSGNPGWILLEWVDECNLPSKCLCPTCVKEYIEPIFAAADQGGMVLVTETSPSAFEFKGLLDDRGRFVGLDVETALRLDAQIRHWRGREGEEE